jgi:hypothetical protein
MGNVNHFFQFPPCPGKMNLFFQVMTDTDKSLDLAETEAAQAKGPEVVDPKLYEPVFKQAKSGIKTAIDWAIKNDMKFCVYKVPLEYKEEFMPAGEVRKFLQQYATTDIKYVQYDERALTGMRKKWEKENPDKPFVLKRQPSEIVVVLVAPSSAAVHVVYSVPADMSFKPPMDPVEAGNVGGRKISMVDVTAPESSTIFKYQDQVSELVMLELKSQGVYVQSKDDEDDMLDYTINDL